MQALALQLLMYAVFPLWVAAGLADWACHRASGIERTAGLPENAFHWLLFAQMGLPMAAVALLEINGAVLALVAAAFLVHEFTVWLELRYAVPRREVRPVEQMVHSFMEILPLVSLALLAVAAQRPGEFTPRLKAEPWPLSYLLGAAVAAALFNVLPLAEEGWRCLRATRTPARPAPR